MNKIYISFLCLFFMVPTSLLAQSLIKGVVTDAETNEPMVGVNVAIKETQHGTITDDKGEFNLSVKQGSYTVIFSYVGYESVSRRVTYFDKKTEQILKITLKPSAKKIKEVVITAKSEAREIREKAMPIAVIDIAELQGTVSEISDILSKTSGVKIKMSGGVGSASKISLRGLEGKRIGFFVDGKPLNNNSDFIDVNDISTDFIERIEIYKGIVPAKLGGSAVGGAVNIVLKEYPPKYMDASYTVKSFNTHKASFSYKRNKNGIEGGIGGYYTYSDNNYQMTTPEEYGRHTVIRDHDKFKKLTAAGAITFKKWWFDEITFEPTIILTEKEIQGIEYNIQEAKSYSNAFFLSNILEKNNFLFDGLDFSLEQFYFYTIYQYNDKSKYTYNWDGTIKDTVYFTELGIGEGEVGSLPNEADIRKNNYSQKLNLNYVLNQKHSVNFNSMYMHVKGIPEDPLKDAVIGYKTDFNSTMNSWVAGLSHEFNSLNKKISNMLNAKFYYYSMQTKLVDPEDLTYTPIDIDNIKKDFGISEAIRYRFTPNFLVKSSVAYDIRLPTDEELLGDGFMTIASADLKPERNTSFNLGFMYDIDRKYQIEINGFYMYLEDMIRFTGGLLQNKYVNFGKMKTIGAEIEIKADVTNWLYLWGNVTYQDLRDARKHEPGSTAKNPTYWCRMPNVPYLYANAGIELHKANLFGSKGQNTRLFSDCSFVEEYFYDFEMSIYQERRIPRALTLNAGIEHSFRNQGIFISIQANNLTNAKVYSEFNRPLPGINYGLKLRYILK